MTKNIEKYLHKDFDKEAGRQHAYKRTKIVATVGPACDTYEKLLDLVKAGVNVFRLNFSHGNYEDKAKIIKKPKLKFTACKENFIPSMIIKFPHGIATVTAKPIMTGIEGAKI